MNNTETPIAKVNCRKIEPVIIRNAAGDLIVQECGTCGRGIERMPKGWMHTR